MIKVKVGECNFVADQSALRILFEHLAYTGASSFRPRGRPRGYVKNAARDYVNRECVDLVRDAATKGPHGTLDKVFARGVAGNGSSSAASATLPEREAFVDRISKRARADGISLKPRAIRRAIKAWAKANGVWPDE